MQRKTDPLLQFTTPHLLCSSDCEPQRLRELLRHADAESLRLWEELSLGYTESQGLPLLRAEIAKLVPDRYPEGHKYHGLRAKFWTVGKTLRLVNR